MAALRMPAVFFGHGNPMNAVQRNAWTQAWGALGASIPRPRAILSVSAHWYLSGAAVTAQPRPRTIHDFGGFPAELYENPVPRARRSGTGRARGAIAGAAAVAMDASWGLDHGTWSVLVHAFPQADIPVVQLSIDETRDASWHYETAKKLAALGEGARIASERLWRQ